MKSGVYRIFHNPSKSVYIGQSIDIDQRWEKHKNDLLSLSHHNIHLSELFENIGGLTNLRFEIIVLAPKIENQLKLQKFLALEEMFEIKYHKSIGWNVLNRTVGGDISLSKNSWEIYYKNHQEDEKIRIENTKKNHAKKTNERRNLEDKKEKVSSLISIFRQLNPKRERIIGRIIRRKSIIWKILGLMPTKTRKIELLTELKTLINIRNNFNLNYFNLRNELKEIGYDLPFEYSQQKFIEIRYKLKKDAYALRNSKHELKIKNIKKDDIKFDPKKINDLELTLAISKFSILSIDEYKNLNSSDKNTNQIKKDNDELADALISLTNGALFKMPEAYLMLGKLYQSGIFFNQSANKAIAYLHFATKYSTTKNGACECLGNLFSDGEICKINYKNSIYYYEIAANNGEKFSVHCLGNIFSDKKNEDYDIDKAIYWYEFAFNKGCEYSALELGLIYLQGEKLQQNLSTAKIWLERATETSYDGTAEYELGFIYRDGLGVINDYEIGAEYIKKAVILGSESARYTMGWIYEYGEGFEKNLIKAYAWYLLSNESESEMLTLKNKLSANEIAVAELLSKQLL